MISNDARRLLPLSPAVLYVLLAVSSGPKHGYAIMQETGALSNGSFRMGPGTLYSTIQKLVGLELLSEKTDDAAEDSRRRYYELTDGGRILLETDVARMKQAVTMANLRLTPGTAGE
jgi:DNA-binding PadR family transcriptional regulator